MSIYMSLLKKGTKKERNDHMAQRGMTTENQTLRKEIMLPVFFFSEIVFQNI